MTGTFRPEPEASAELEDAALWCESRRPELGIEFTEAVTSPSRWAGAGKRVDRRAPDGGAAGN